MLRSDNEDHCSGNRFDPRVVEAFLELPHADFALGEEDRTVRTLTCVFC